MTALPERDETAAICRDRNSFPESDPSFPDTGRVRLPNGDDPLDEMGIPAGVQEYFDREIKHHTPDAWINTSRRHTAASSRPGRLGRSGPTPAALSMRWSRCSDCGFGPEPDSATFEAVIHPISYHLYLGVDVPKL